MEEVQVITRFCQCQLPSHVSRKSSNLFHHSIAVTCTPDEVLLASGDGASHVDGDGQWCGARCGRRKGGGTPGL